MSCPVVSLALDELLTPLPLLVVGMSKQKTKGVGLCITAQQKNATYSPCPPYVVTKAGWYLLMEPLMLNGFQVHGVQGDDARGGVIEALHQIDDGGLATSACAHQGDLAPRWYMQAHILQHLDQ